LFFVSVSFLLLLVDLSFFLVCFYLFLFSLLFLSLFFFFNDTASTEIYTLSLHDALPILGLDLTEAEALHQPLLGVVVAGADDVRSEEHTSELQSRFDLVCRLLLEKKKKITYSSQESVTYSAHELNDSTTVGLFKLSSKVG